MKNIIGAFAMIFLLAAFVTKKEDRNVQSFKWLEGSWIMKKKNGSSIMESWHPQSDSILLGESLSVSVAGQSKVLENLRLVHRSGNYYYISKVNGQNNNEEVAFRITSHSEKGFVAEKPDHDFPKRITYELVNKDSIHAFIDGGPSQPEKKSDFYYSRYKN